MALSQQPAARSTLSTGLSSFSDRRTGGGSGVDAFYNPSLHGAAYYESVIYTPLGGGHGLVAMDVVIPSLSDMTHDGFTNDRFFNKSVTNRTISEPNIA
ncbi:hypothetical protein, partial [Candidatus Methylomirabilis sp.]|uniref:hypothetical protein n=1 Tax=Candidatus Methylomirabilis sp. TaxID=2032687 RepID=UPI003C743A6F